MAGEGDRVEVIITTISGEELAAFRIHPQVRVSKVKDLVHEEFGYPARAQNFLQHGKMVEDEGLVEALPQPRLLSLVLLPFEKASAFYRAAQAGHEAAVRNLLLRMASDGLECGDVLLLAQGRHQYTALHYAADGGHDTLCRALIAAAPNHEVSSRMLLAEDEPLAWTALHLAASKGHGAACQVLLESAPTLEVRKWMLTARVLGGQTALHLAASRAREAALGRLLDSAPSPEVRRGILSAADDAGSTALHLAASKGSDVACQALLGFAPSVEVKREMLLTENKMGRTPTHLAAGNSDEMACQALLKLAADLELQK